MHLLDKIEHVFCCEGTYSSTYIHLKYKNFNIAHNKSMCVLNVRNTLNEKLFLINGACMSSYICYSYCSVSKLPATCAINA